MDYSGRLILPGLTDLHMHAPQFSFRGLGMDAELLDWLNLRAFPEEGKYADLEYARKAYSFLITHLKKSPNTRIALFGTVHVKATLLLMKLLEESGLVCLVGKVSMDRNCPDFIREQDAAASLAAVREWLLECGGTVRPILTPRFIPSCSDELMKGLGDLRKEFSLPLQSHLSENRREIDWVRELCPGSNSYTGAYADYGFFDGESPVVMAHCVWLGEDEMDLLRERGVYIAHCPQSNTNLASGIAPARRFIEKGISPGLGSDVAGGSQVSIFRAMGDAIQVSKLRAALVEADQKPLTVEEVFYMGTAGGASFFEKAGLGASGSFEQGCELDALVMDDSALNLFSDLSIRDRLERILYLSDDRHIVSKFVRGKQLF